MFDIYIKEAREHIDALAAGFAAWQSAPGAASREFVRAAHTLASSSRTAGFEPIAELAGALEQWMPVAAQSGAYEGLVGSAIDGLRERAEGVYRWRTPAPATDIEPALRQLTARLRAPAPAPVSTTPPAAVPPAPSGGGRQNRVMRDDIDAQL